MSYTDANNVYLSGRFVHDSGSMRYIANVPIVYGTIGVNDYDIPDRYRKGTTSLSVDEIVNNKDKSEKDCITEYLDLILMGELARRGFRRGEFIIIHEARLHKFTYEDKKTGKKTTKVKIIPTHVSLGWGHETVALRVQRHTLYAYLTYDKNKKKIPVAPISTPTPNPNDYTLHQGKITKNLKVKDNILKRIWNAIIDV